MLGKKLKAYLDEKFPDLLDRLDEIKRLNTNLEALEKQLAKLNGYLAMAPVLLKSVDFDDIKSVINIFKEFTPRDVENIIYTIKSWALNRSPGRHKKT